MNSDSHSETHIYGSPGNVLQIETNYGSIIIDNSPSRDTAVVNKDGQTWTIPFLAPPQTLYQINDLAYGSNYSLVGRSYQLQKVKNYLYAGNASTRCALHGIPGVGKTALLIALAYDREVLEHYPDGILWAGLGQKPDVPALLGRWCRAVGIPSNKVSELTSIEERQQALRSAINDKRMLLIIDDAWQLNAALQFIGGRNCTHLVTTRLPVLAIYFALNNARITLEELSQTEGLALLKRMAPGVVAKMPDEARSLVQAVGGLPLALILMGRYLHLQEEFDQPNRLNRALQRLRDIKFSKSNAIQNENFNYFPTSAEDIEKALQTVIGISEEALSADELKVLKALSIFPSKPNSFSEDAALAAANTNGETLDKLSDHGFLESSGPGRYTLHQTISNHARDRSFDIDACLRMMKFYSNLVQRTEYKTLDIDNENLLETLRIAHKNKMYEALVSGINAFYPFLEARGLYEAAKTHLIHAKEASELLRDEASLGAVLLNLGRIAEKCGDYPQAEEYLQKSLPLVSIANDSKTICDLRHILGIVAFNRSKYDNSEAHLKAGLELSQMIQDKGRTCHMLHRLELVSFYRGQFEQAKSYAQEALDLASDIDQWQHIKALLYTDLGRIALAQEEYDRAKDYVNKALEFSYDVGNVEIISSVHQIESRLALEEGNFKQAEDQMLLSLLLADRTGHRWYKAYFLIEYGKVHLKQLKDEDMSKAEISFNDALNLSQEMGCPDLEAHALYCLARVAFYKGRLDQARSQGKASLAIYEHIGHFKTREVEQWLSSLTV